MTKKRIKIVCIIVLVMLILLFLISIYFFRMTMFMDRSKTNGCSRKFLKDNGINNIDNIFSNKAVKKCLKSKYGHDIPIEHVKVNESFDNTTVILVHGHEMDLVSMYPIADVFLKNGIDVVLYDQRAHGGNTAGHVTFGCYEKDDLEQVVDYVYNGMKDKKPIGLLGQSMGASTCGLYLGQDHANKHIKFAVLDCPYNNMWSILEFLAKKRGYSDFVIKFLLKDLNIFNRIYSGFWYKDVDVCESIKHTNVPVLIYQMEQDNTCPAYMAKEVFDSIKHDNKEIINFKEGGHIRGFYKKNDVYVSELFEFIDKYGK